MALFAAVSLYASDLNIYASGLKASQQDSMVTVEYILNAQADSFQLMLYGEDINQALSMTETRAEALSKGLHRMTYELPHDIPVGVYNWAMKAFAAPNDSIVRVMADTATTYAVPRGLDVDKDPNSPSFGYIYIADAIDAVEDGAVSYYPASMDKIVGLTTSDWSASKASPMRLSVGEDHLLYITDWSDNAPNIHIVDPQKPTAGDQLVFGGTNSGSAGIFVDAQNNPIHGSMSHCYVAGQGANRVLYTFDEDLMSGAYPMGVFRYDIGELASPWEAVPSAIVYDNADHYEQNGNSAISPDGKGGWWISQYRAADSESIPMVIHLSAAGVVDFNSSGTFSPYNRGGMGLNADKTQLASPATGKIDVYNIAWNEGVPTLTLAYSVATVADAQTCYNVAFDYAGNLYATYDGQDIYAIAPVKADNSCLTPAPADSKVYIGVPVPVQDLYLMGDNVGWNPTQGTPLTRVSDQVFEGVFTFTKDTSYFAFFDALAENNDQGGWDYVNAHRYAGAEDNHLLNKAVLTDTIAKANHSFMVAPAGQYKLRVDLNTNKVKMFYQAPAVIEDNAIFIAFKDIPGKEDSDNSSAVSSIADIIEAGAEYIDSIPVATKIYNAREGCGVKFGTGSAAGELKIRLANAVIPDAIIINAVSYNASEGTAVLMGDTVVLKDAGNKVLAPYTKTYDGRTIVSELTFATTAKRMYLLDVIIIPHSGEVPTGYRIKHPWDVNNIDPWIWQNCEEQADGTWALEDRYYGGGCNIDPKVLEQDWIAEPTLVGNPYNGDSCRFVINPAALEIADILTITKLGEPNPEDTTKVIYDHLYEIGANQGWDPSAGVEMTKKAENVFEGTFAFPANGDSYFGFIADLGADASDWTTANSRRFGPASDGVLAEIGTNEIHAIPGKSFSYKITTGVYVFTVDLNNMTLTVALADGLNNIEGENNVQKVLINGQIYIIRDGETYTITGAKLD